MKNRTILFLLLAPLSGCAPGRIAPAPTKLDYASQHNHLTATLTVPGTVTIPAFPANPTFLTRSEIQERIGNLQTPQLQAEAQRYREALGKRDQAALWPNPGLMVRKEMMGHGEGLGGGLTKVEISQRIELGGKRAARTARAVADAETILHQFSETRRRARREGELVFGKILRHQEELALAREEMKQTEELTKLGLVLARSGKISTTELNKFEVAATKAKLDVWDLEKKHQQACLQLDRLLGAPAGTTAGVKGKWATNETPQKATDKLGSHPRYRAREKALAASQLALTEADAKAWPDLTLMVMGMNDDFMKDSYYGFGFRLPLPIFDRNQGSCLTAQAALHRAKQALLAEKANLAAELDSAFSAWDQASYLVTGYQQDIIPKVELTYKLTKGTYREGRASHLQLMDSLILLIRTRRALVAHLEAQLIALVEIDYLIGN